MPVESIQSLSKFMEDVIASNDPTPDFHRYNRSKKIPVFIYDDMKKAHDPYHTMEKDSTFIGRGITSSNDFGLALTKTEKWVSCIALRKKLSHSYPKGFDFLFYPKEKVREHSWVPAGRIFGELWLVNPNKLFELDNNNANGYSMSRELHKILIQSRNKESSQMTSINALMYVAKTEVWEEPGGVNINTIKINPIKDNPMFRDQPVYTYSPSLLREVLSA